MRISELIPQLEEIVDFYRDESPTFPFTFCSDISNKLYLRFGFLWVKGKYTGKFDPEYIAQLQKIGTLSDKVCEIGHDFSYIPELRLFVDLTAMQFNRSYPPILLLQREDTRIALNLSQKNDKTTHYVEGVYNNKRHRTILDLLPN